jgi:magnesium chelatase family protein
MVPQLKHHTLTNLQVAPQQPETAESLRARVVDARQRQLRRQGPNCWLGITELQNEIANASLPPSFLTHALQQFQLSARSYHKVWRIARSIADLEAAEIVSQTHMIEALGFRSLPWEQGLK